MSPWFRVDDGLSMKSETTRIPRALRTAAIGLMTLAGSWAARELTDGHIPAHMLDELAGNKDEAGWLVTAGFWNVAENGWQFVVWGPDQPLREAVLADRAARAEKMRDWRSRNKPRNPPTDPPTDSATSSATDEAVAGAVKHAQPFPAQPSPSKEHVQKRPALEYPNEFEEWWGRYPRHQGKVDAARAFKAARKTTEFKTLLDGAQAYTLLQIGSEKSVMKMPAGWLRDRRWEDDPIPAHVPDTRLSPTDRTLDRNQNSSMPRPPTDSEYRSRMCSEPGHEEYPLPCEACKRRVGLNTGVEF